MTGRPPAQIVAALSRVDRVTGRGLRESERRRRAVGRRRAGKADIDACEALIKRLTEAHHVAFKRVDWGEIVETGPVAPAVPRDAVSAAARQKLANYRPSLADTLLGREAERRRELNDKVLEAAKADAELYAKAKAAADMHNRMLALAAEVKKTNPDAIAGVLKVNGAAAALKDVVEAFRLYAAGPRLVVELDLIEFDALPDETCRAIAGVAAWSDLTPTERCELQLDNAASVVLRAAVEVLQVAPVETVEVVARVMRPGGLADTDFDIVLHVKVPALAMAKANLKKMAAPSVLTALGAKLNWTPLRSFAPIDLGDPALEPRRAAA
jgi:hypothetical protein